MGKICPECGAVIETDEAAFCPMCGASLSAGSSSDYSSGLSFEAVLYCPKCGAPLPLTALFCSQCGEPISVDDDTVANADEPRKTPEDCETVMKTKPDASHAASKRVEEEEKRQKLEDGKKRKAKAEAPLKAPKEEAKETKEKPTTGLDKTVTVYTHDPSFHWETIKIPKEAMLCEWDDRVAFRMPDGKYGQYKFNVLTSNLRDMGDHFEVTYRADLSCIMVGGERNIAISTKRFAQEFKKPKFRHVFINERIPISTKHKMKINGETVYVSREDTIEKNLPEELKEDKRWVITLDTQITQLDEKGKKIPKWGHRFIDPRTGEDADINNPDTWGTYEDAMAWAKMCGGYSLAYAVDGSNGVCAVTNGTLQGEKKKDDEFGVKFYRNADKMDGDISSVPMTEEYLGSEKRFFKEGSFVDVRGVTSEIGDMGDENERQAVRDIFGERHKRSLEDQNRNAQTAISRADYSNTDRGKAFINLYRGNGNPKKSYRQNQQAFIDGAAYFCDKDPDAMLDAIASSAGRYFDRSKSVEYYEGMIKKGIERCPYGWSSKRAQAEEKKAKKAAFRAAKQKRK